MRTIATFPDLASAEMARSALEAEGIPAMVPDAEFAGLDWRLSTALGGVRLQVPAEEADADDVCPYCTSRDVRPDRHQRITALSMLFFPLLIIALPLRLLSLGKYKCSTCGRTWRQSKRRVG